MKKITALLLAVLLVASLSVSAFAEGENDVYALLSGLMNDREFTLTVTAEEIDGLEEYLEPYGTVVCNVKQEDDTIVLDVTTEGEAYLKAAANAEGVMLSTNFIEMDDVVTTWDVLLPNVTVTKDESSASVKIGMTGPNQELINFSVKIKGTDLADYSAEFYIGFITGPGTVYTLWDSISGENGETARDFAFTWDEYELIAEASGEEAAEDGCISRSDVCSFFMDDEEIGTVTVHSELVTHTNF